VASTNPTGLIVHDSSNIQAFAMKQFPISSSMKEELDVLRRVTTDKHPNIVKLQDCWVGADTGYIVMELCKGTLEDLQKTHQKPLPPLLLYEILVQVAKGTEHLHTHGVCHRDLKPANGKVTIVAESNKQSYTRTTRNLISKSRISTYLAMYPLDLRVKQINLADREITWRRKSHMKETITQAPISGV
jgi:serine/threonine protein kinase